MDYCIVVISLLLALSTSVNGQTIGSPIQSPAPEYTNLTELLSVAGPFNTFLDYLVSTKVIDTFQGQANNTEEGITLFVPKDSAFSKLKKPSLSNLTGDQFKSLCLFHALPHYYSLADFKNLSEISPVSTFAGGELYSLNFSYVSGTIHLSSGWANTKVSSAVHATYPVAVYQVDKVLLPEAIFGTNIPPAPVVDIAPDVDTPDHGKNVAASSSDSSSHSSSYRMMNWGMLNHLFWAIVGGFLIFLLF
ncbi:hypothetical protein H5410_059666 [Solanum commersonii]|uniref:FAS1 domain-containing protein n=1 Tax=Solanum commersonii TaxID=4109 RepID=A0A9J5W3N3_SOLCO|nr:hypothetical protein H5410_059666 [Solanum commersonii]